MNELHSGIAINAWGCGAQGTQWRDARTRLQVAYSRCDTAFNQPGDAQKR